jgi:DNA-binding GntR family transcriptional regulator
MERVEFDWEQNSGVLEKKSLAYQAFEFLSRGIILRTYRPGDRLRQDDIAAQLGVSITPVREAFDRLVSVGLAERIPYRGVRVPKLTNDEMLDAHVARLILEVAVVRLAAHHISQQQLIALHDILEQTRNLTTDENMSEHRQLNREFHFTIANAASNPQIFSYYEMASTKFPDWMLYEWIFRQTEPLESVLIQDFEEHRAMVDAIASHDADLAAQRAMEHMEGVGKQLVTYSGIPLAMLQERVREVGLP